MSYAPAGYQTVTPYLIVPNAEGFISFIKDVFAAKELSRHMRDESIIMHAAVKVGDSMIMFADSTPQYAPATAHLFVYVQDADATYELALQKGATTVMPPADQNYGRSCGVLDPHGNTWWITSVPK